MTPLVVDKTKDVVKAVKNGTFTSLGRAGASIRGVARKSLGKSKKPSKPGQPPRSPTARLRDSIYFAVDKERGSVVIGPTRTGAGRVGHTHEFSDTETNVKRPKRTANFKFRVGGHGPIRVTRTGKIKGVATLATREQLDRSLDLVERMNVPPWDLGEVTTSPRKYPARPFMGPALDVSEERLPHLWENVLKES